jgi:hypothetical protein
MTEKELLTVANGGHRAFMGCLRKGIKEHARRAGAALTVLKSRHKHGKWTAWLKQHFKGSPGWARLYMRIYKHWPQIVELGLDGDDVSLEDIRWVFSDSKTDSPTARRAASKAKATKASGPELTVDGDAAGADAAGAEDKGREAPPVPETREVKLLFSGDDDANDFVEEVEELQAAWGISSQTDAVCEAVRRCLVQAREGKEASHA